LFLTMVDITLLEAFSLFQIFLHYCHYLMVHYPIC
jgi:hypothetical protein